MEAQWNVISLRRCCEYIFFYILRRYFFSYFSSWIVDSLAFWYSKCSFFSLHHACHKLFCLCSLFACVSLFIIEPFFVCIHTVYAPWLRMHNHIAYRCIHAYVCTFNHFVKSIYEYKSGHSHFSTLLCVYVACSSMEFIRYTNSQIRYFQIHFISQINFWVLKECHHQNSNCRTSVYSHSALLYLIGTFQRI